MNYKTLPLLSLFLLASCSSETKETVLDTKLNLVKQAKEVVKETNKQTTRIQSSSTNGASLYASKCASCHGKNADKSALNASAILVGWTSTKVQEALKSYQSNKEFGGSMKGIMQGQSKPLTASDIKLISDYISVL